MIVIVLSWDYTIQFWNHSELNDKILWKVWNDKIFNGRNYLAHEVVEEIKVLSSRWILSRTKLPVGLFYEWSWGPISCLNREGRR